jgi:hypothetical protein
MLGNLRKGFDDLDALDRVVDWTRARFGLAQDAAVFVAEVACTLPGCPPLETVVAFWDAGVRHHFKVFKRLADVVEDDLPFAWLKDSLVLPDGVACECC